MNDPIDTSTRLEHVENSLEAAQERMERLCNSWFRIIEKEPLPQDATIAAWSERIGRDPTLRYPHLKVLRVLLEEWNPEAATFGSVGFNVLTRQARVGKNLLQDYLAWLRTRGYIRLMRENNCLRISMRVHN